MTVSTSQPPLPAPPQPLPAQDRMTRRRSNTTSTDPSPPSAALLPSHVPPKTRANLDSSSSAIPIAPRRAKAIPVIPPPSAPIHGFSSTSGRRVVVEAPVDCGFPPSSAEGKVLEEDLRDGALMAVCACLMASVSNSDDFMFALRSMRGVETMRLRLGFLPLWPVSQSMLTNHPISIRSLLRIIKRWD
jgi:hypothetical protein